MSGAKRIQATRATTIPPAKASHDHLDQCIACLSGGRGIAGSGGQHWRDVLERKKSAWDVRVPEPGVRVWALPRSNERMTLPAFRFVLSQVSESRSGASGVAVNGERGRTGCHLDSWFPTLARWSRARMGHPALCGLGCTKDNSGSFDSPSSGLPSLRRRV